MDGVRLAARIVEVIADLGEDAQPRYRYGSGCVVRGRTVLTAAHVVAGAQAVRVRYPDKKLRHARADARLVGGGAGPDLALVDVADEGIDLAAIELAVVDRDSPAAMPVEDCHAVGYPWFAETPSPSAVRDTVDAWGYIPVLSNLASGLLTVQVTNSPEPLPPERTALGESQWSGMSGAPVIADDCLLGVVSEHAPRAGPSAITAVPLSALEPDPAHPEWGPGVSDAGQWWARLGVAGLKGLRRLPVRKARVEPEYWATVREIHKRTSQLLGREQKLAELAAFATGAAGYWWLTGDAWAGKTSLLAEAVSMLQGECDVVCYFLSRREAHADSSRFLAAVVPQLAYLLEEDPPAAELDQFRALWQRAAERAETEDRHMLLVVDGLDEDLRPPGLPSVAALLPSIAGGHAHVMVSSRPYPQLPSDLPPRHPLALVQPVPLEPFAGAQQLALLARQEIDNLIHRDDELTADVLGLLTAAAGPLAVEDLAAMTEWAPQSAALRRQIRRIVTLDSARSLQSVGPAGINRYQFAHASLLEYAQTNDDLNDPEFRRRIHRWVKTWHDAGWPLPGADGDGTPQYLLDTYPSTLVHEPEQLVALVGDVGWVDTAIQSVGVDRVLASLRAARAALPGHLQVAATFAVVAGQIQYLRLLRPLGQAGYVLRQLCLQAAQLNEDRLADDLRARLRAQPSPGLVPLWTTRRASSARAGEIGRGFGQLMAAAVLPDGRVASGNEYGNVLIWDLAVPGGGQVALGNHEGGVAALAVLPDGRVVSGGGDGRVLAWDPAVPGAGPVELGRHDGAVRAVTVLPDGRVVSGGDDGRWLLWDPATPGAGPGELGHQDRPRALAVLPDGRVVTGGDDGRVLAWDPAIPRSSPVEIGRHEVTPTWGESSYGRRRVYEGVSAVGALADGRVVSGGHDQRVLVWELGALTTGPAELGETYGPARALAVLPDGRVVSADDGGNLVLWDPGTPGAGCSELGRHDETDLGARPGMGLVALPDGRVVSGDGGNLVLWDPAIPGTGPVTQRGHEGKVRVVAVLLDGRVVSGGEDGQLLVWDPATPGSSPAEIGRVEGSVNQATVLPDGRMVTSGGFEGRLLVWDPATPGAKPIKLGHHKGIVAVAALPDGRVVSGGRGRGRGLRLLVWDPATPGAEPFKLGRVKSESGLGVVAALSDGRVVSTEWFGPILLWDPATPGADPVELGHHGEFLEGRVFGGVLAALPDGRVVSGGDDGRVLVWDPATPGSGPVELGDHKGAVAAVARLPDGRVVSGAYDWVVAWDATTRSEVARLGCTVNAIATGPDGPAESCLVVAHEDAGFTLWSVTGEPADDLL